MSYIGQLWEFIINIIQWIHIHINVGWLSFVLALIIFRRNNHKKLMQSFEYSSESDPLKTNIVVYNNSIGTEASRFIGIMVTDRQFYLYRRLLAYVISFDKSNNRTIYPKKSRTYHILSKILKYEDTQIYPYREMLNCQNSDELVKTGFTPIKSHEMRTIVISKNNFLCAFKNRLMSNNKVLMRFINEKPVYIYFIYQTLNGKIKEFVLKTDYQDALGKDLDMEELKRTYVAQNKCREN